jgi:signal transduction histidine kinase
VTHRCLATLRKDVCPGGRCSEASLNNVIEGAIAVTAAPAETAVQLPWLAPGVASLVALTRPDQPASWTAVITDPAAVLLLLRQIPHDHPHEPFRPLSHAAAALRLASDLLGRPQAGVLDQMHSAVPSVFAIGRDIAATARAVARASGRVNQECAAVAGLLAPLGWLALTAAGPDAVAACLTDEMLSTQPDATQIKHFGATTAEVARRLSRRWDLPAWLVAVIGYPDLPAGLAQTFGGDSALIAAIHAAVHLTAAGNNHSFGLTVGTPLEEALAHLGIEAEKVVVPSPTAAEPPCSNPYSAPLLRELLELAAENADRRELHLVPRLESEIDRLHRLLLNQRAGESIRLKAQKLAALAEFAAGAGHEINNPLAVISGQAQYLLTLEADSDRQKALRTVVHQTQRVHQILTDLMQFAKPSRPQKQPIDLRDTARDVADSLVDLAAGRKVRVELLLPDERCATDGDAKQISTAVASLLRNAIEAAPADGWARLRLDPAGESLRILVEDSGPGPAANHAEHLFDPFFSGRAAGRGRGLGLATAWRLVREHGGDLAYEPVPGGPTRFVMTFPRLVDPPAVQPMAA